MASDGDCEEEPGEKIQLFADLMWQARDWGNLNLHTRGSTIRWEVLIAVARSPGTRMNYSTLESAIGRPHRTLQYVIRDLEAIGLVRLQRAQSDRRRMVIALTEQGREAFAAYIDHIEGLMRKLTGAGYGLPQPLGGAGHGVRL
ncbi:MAG TPA: MarR family winged helix-turn-helix transcriptional regulator [Alphaproteobacteria bacterium]